jgi:GH35 family endo-1,4-beta-xylanase/beta-xylosidase
MKMKKLLGIAMVLTAGSLSGFRAIRRATGAPAGIPSLKQVFHDDFLIGTCMNVDQIEGRDARADSLIGKQFNAVTPENIMKAALIHPGWDTYRFELADQMVDYAQKNHIRINAHTLIWHSQLPPFVRRLRDADSVRQFFENHITTLASRYDGKVYSWDVVNEALNEDGTLRNSIFLQKLGPDYIVEAFRLAQRAAPHTQLYYNDYNIENPDKRAGAIDIVRKIQSAGVRIDAIGIQGHWHLGKVPFRNIAESIDAFAKLGIKVNFTELDISVLPDPLNGNTADVNATSAGGRNGNPWPDGLPDSVQERLAADYAALFRLFLQHKDQIGRVTFWGVDDGVSWLNDWPVRGRTNYPLLFDRDYTPKKAFYRVIDAAGHPAAPESAAFYNSVRTYVNPVLPGDHPDPTLLRVGEDFYHCGSSFHFTPYLPIYHSRDLVHWEVIARVVPPSEASFVADRPSGGIWQGAITYFYGSYWIYFSSGGQWFSRAASPYGPWTSPVKVSTNTTTGDLGYDNSIFVDDDGKPYMVIKNGQKVNRIQALGRDGQLSDTVINLDWVNAGLQYSWAEGPVMCKRNGYYYYFPAGDVSGGQYVLRTRKLTSDSTYWERLGDFFRPVTDPGEGFRRPNHISAPLQLSDGTWWTLGQSYERYGSDDWYGTGRQTSLYPVVWDGDRPWGMAPTTQPIVKPDLPPAGIPWTSVRGDDFDSARLGLQWHFLTRKAADNYSLSARKGWIRLTPRNGRTHLVQKETDHYYAVVTRLDLDATDSAAGAGIYLTNGNQREVARLYTGYEGGRKIIFRLDTAIRSVVNTAGRIVWLKLVRNGHTLSGYFSGDGSRWKPLGAPISAARLDREQPNYNSWVGTSLGLFAEGRPADFDLFVCKDAFSSLQAAGYANYYGVRTLAGGGERPVTNTAPEGGWLMISGVETGKRTAGAIALTASAKAAAKLEIWLDDLGKGTLLGTVTVRATGGDDVWRTCTQPLKRFSGHHDVFIKYPSGQAGAVSIRSIRFVKAQP